MPGDGESRKTGLRPLGRLSGGSEGLQVADELPALGLRQLGPDGHSVSHYAVGKDPEKGSGRGLLYRISEQTRRLPATFRHFAVALGTVESEKLFAGCYGITLGPNQVAAGDRGVTDRLGIGILLQRGLLPSRDTGAGIAGALAPRTERGWREWRHPKCPIEAGR